MVAIWIYVDTGKQVGDLDHLKVSQMRLRPIRGSLKTIRKARHSDTRCSSDRPSLSHHSAVPGISPPMSARAAVWTGSALASPRLDTHGTRPCPTEMV